MAKETLPTKKRSSKSTKSTSRPKKTPRVAGNRDSGVVGPPRKLKDPPANSQNVAQPTKASNANAATSPNLNDVEPESLTDDINVGCPHWNASLDSSWDANCQNPYLRELLDSRGLKIRNPKTVSEAFSKEFVGLEMAMSFNNFAEISDYWSSAEFKGNPSFTSTMGRNRFSDIRAALMCRPPHITHENLGVDDPLYMIRILLDSFRVRCSEVAVPKGVFAFPRNDISGNSDH